MRGECGVVTVEVIMWVTQIQGQDLTERPEAGEGAFEFFDEPAVLASLCEGRCPRRWVPFDSLHERQRQLC